jgi:aspartate racemase
LTAGRSAAKARFAGGNVTLTKRGAAAMKTIGMLGGMSWESSIAYERIINEEVRRRLGGVHSAELLIRSYDFAVVERLQAAGEWERAGRLLADGARALEAAGAEVLVLCTNTMHEVADLIEAAVAIPFLHIADVTGRAVTAAGLTRPGLLGTRYTMERDFYTGRLERAHGLTVLVPAEPDRTTVHQVIFDELVRGVVRDASRAAYLEVIGRLRQRGAEGIIAGCTEIELLVGPADVALPYFPTTRLHALAAVDLALAGG